MLNTARSVSSQDSLPGFHFSKGRSFQNAMDDIAGENVLRLLFCEARRGLVLSIGCCSYVVLQPTEDFPRDLRWWGGSTGFSWSSSLSCQVFTDLRPVEEVRLG